MIKQLHVESQAIFKRVSRPMIERPPVYSTDRKRNMMIRDIQRKRRTIMDYPANEWRVYNLCKQLEQLAEYDGLVLSDMKRTHWYDLLRRMLPSTPRGILFRGAQVYDCAYAERGNADKDKA